MTEFSVPIHYFTKRAKDLQTRVRGCDATALSRVRRVLLDTSTKTDQELASDFGLMRAQHVIAVEHGFTNWKGLTDSPSAEARLAITMAQHPELNDFGIGLYSGHKKKPVEEQRAIVAKDRETLRASTAAVETAVVWLRENIEPIQTINKTRTSYGIKHIANKDIGYITNGVFIAAGIIAGYSYEIVPSSPNVSFGMSEKSLKEISMRRTSPDRVLKRFMPRATEILAKRGIQAFPAQHSATGLVWLDAGDVRTLRLGAIETTPFIVRLYVDHYSLFVSRKVARALGIDTPHYPEARPERRKVEISVLLDEVDTALEWALNSDTRIEPPLPPFEVSGFDGWSYVWSKRASDRYANRPNKPLVK